MVSTSHIIVGVLNLKIYQNFVGTEFFLHLREDKPIWGELKLYGGGGGVIFITTPNYFTSLETVNAQKSEVFYLKISSGNVNASGVITC